jgi:hypothetical protein
VPIAQDMRLESMQMGMPPSKRVLIEDSGK